MKYVTENAFAKINLFLEVEEKRPDSYHNINSIMHSVSLCDVVTIEKNDTIILTNDAGLPNDEKNLAFKAAKAFFEKTSVCGGAKIHIEKHIPVSAGLAGGSTDAAAVLRGLNKIYETSLSISELCVIGSRLGADVPFCIMGGAYITEGIGDIFTPCPSLPECFLVISKAGEGVSTPYAYGEIDNFRENGNVPLVSNNAILNALEKQNVYEISDFLYNVFEKVVCGIRPKVDEQKAIMRINGAVNTLMSGSGPSVFGIFDKEVNAKKALYALIDYGADAHICKPLR